MARVEANAKWFFFCQRRLNTTGSGVLQYLIRFLAFWPFLLHIRDAPEPDRAGALVARVHEEVLVVGQQVGRVGEVPARARRPVCAGPGESATRGPVKE